MTEALAAVAVVVSFAFAASLGERWLARRRPHEAAWCVSLSLFCLASLALWAGASLGWEPWSFRLFYALGAIANVPTARNGTLAMAPRA